MSRPSAALRALAIAAVAAGLSACISLFPKADAVSLHRFGSTAPATPTTAPAGAMFGVLQAPTSFSRAAATDQILTVTNGEVAYIKDARWVSPAIVLFDEAVQRAFGVDGGRARLVARGEPSRSDFVLKLDVRTFETQYVHGAGGAPEVVVGVRVVMTRNNDRSLVGDRLFEARVPAADNRVSAIVPAYDAAVSQVLREVVLWVNAGGSAGR